ncbi:flagellar biosynthesis protein FliR [Variovorax sp. PBS-H4]|uniref:type III secretion system export apparatus subunit SctT n=1 Tax=Variovorax sp. PBS-H4 TaxID=434008 RepID=UPI001318E66D|nr:type III secretion system export apparatus subunit SctT [Variovorax sp. PBS-H4]VTU27174.1 flagellar biosynthesis protein FliR [Variovorax sp. PBS-H4]
MDLFHAPLQFIATFGYAMPRILGVFSIVPLLSREALPPMLRVGVTGCFAMLLMPGLAEGAAQNREAHELAFIMGREALLGALIGFVLALPFWAVEAMGDIIDTQRGTNLSQTLNPLTGHETSPLGQLFNQAIVTFAFVTGGFLLVLSVIYDSFLLWPVFQAWPAPALDAAPVLLQQLDKLMRLMLLLGAPVIFAMLLCESGLALISRFVPQLQVFFLAMPIKSAVAMVVLAIYAPVLFDVTYSTLRETYAQALSTASEVFPAARSR